MKSAVVVFPASNCDRDAAVALEQLTGEKPAYGWHADSELPDVDLIVLPGGFAYGDYLRCGAMAAQSRIMRDVKKKADEGRAVLGICNGFQVLTETGLLPGALMRNAISNSSAGRSASKSRKRNRPSPANTTRARSFRFPVAHGDGNYFADDETLDRLEGEGRVVFRYAQGDNPNGSARNIAGILSEKRNVLGLMPHPERVCDPLLGGTDGVAPVPEPDRSAVMTDITPQIVREHGLSVEEYGRIKQLLNRDPNLVELGVFSVMWSEHCSYKSTRAHLRRLPTKAPWVLQGPGENAGVIDIGDGDVASSRWKATTIPPSSSPIRARRPASAASCAMCSPWARGRSR
jgi:phosphoribosylformylglycinamidine synthase I